MYLAQLLIGIIEVRFSLIVYKLGLNVIQLKGEIIMASSNIIEFRL